jgi:hypothetical protein
VPATCVTHRLPVCSALVLSQALVSSLTVPRRELLTLVHGTAPQTQGDPATQLRFHFFNSFFYKKLTQELKGINWTRIEKGETEAYAKQYATVKRWTKHVDVFEKVALPPARPKRCTAKGKVANRNVRDSGGGDELMPPFPHLRRFPSTRLKPVPRATRTPRKVGLCPWFKEHFVSRRAKPLALRIATLASLYAPTAGE